MKEFIKKNFDLIGNLLLIIFFVIFNYRIYTNMDLLIDSDMASEMLYSKLLAENKRIFLDSWYYSTAIETLDIPLVFAPLFFLTNNWHTIRIIGIIILDIMLFLSFKYLCKQLKVKHISWLAMLVIGGVSNEYFDFVLKGSYYVPYIMVSFFTTGLLLDVCENKNIIKIIILYTLSILAGLNGLRQLAQCYVCLFGTCFIVFIVYQFNNLKNKVIEKDNKTFKLLKLSFISLLFACVGYLLNIFVLSNLYSYKSSWNINIELASINKLKDIIYGFTTMFGYETNYLWTIIIALAIFALIVTSVFYILTHKENNFNGIFMIVLFLISCIITVLIFTFTNMNLQIRYFIQVFMNSVFVLGLYINNINFNKRCIIYILLAVCVLLCSNFQLNKDIRFSTNQDLIKIKDILLENNSYEGYGSFWNANVMTELSDGKIDVWNFYNYEKKDEVNLLNLDKWLQKKEHFNNNPKGKIFVILYNWQDENINFTKEAENYIYYKGDSRVLYIFDDYTKLIKCLNN